jgi:hypothetical protein
MGARLANSNAAAACGCCYSGPACLSCHKPAVLAVPAVASSLLLVGQKRSEHSCGFLMEVFCNLANRPHDRSVGRRRRCAWAYRPRRPRRRRGNGAQHRGGTARSTGGGTDSGDHASCAAAPAGTDCCRGAGRHRVASRRPARLGAAPTRRVAEESSEAEGPTAAALLNRLNGTPGSPSRLRDEACYRKLLSEMVCVGLRSSLRRRTSVRGYVVS